ncbi:MAG TPA: murein biosynthesis integral membrane protein MurJ [Gammaproteobacteria bacterium]|nr:murein biosynthesis integral membrane protein MurJ [Gammaproteobacteria bacterium]
MAAGLFRSTATIGAMTLISRILGFVRDMVVARVFGAGMATDAFFVAFKLPNFFRRLFAEGAFAPAFVPVFTEYREQRSATELQQLLAAVSGVLLAVVAAVTVLGVVGAPLLVAVFGMGWGDDPAKLALAADLLRVTFPYLLFISLVAMAGAALNTFARFAAPAFTPVLLNVAMIAAALWWAPAFERPIEALAWGVFAGGALQLVFQWPFLRRLGLAVRPRFRPGHPGVRRIVRLMGPSVLAVSVVQVSILIDTVLATFLAEGSVSFLYYADRLVQFPMGIFGIALGTAILPTLSGLAGRGEDAAFSRTLDRALRLIVTIGLPASVALILLGRPILVSLFQYGAFTAEQAALTQQALAAYAVGLVGMIGVKVLAPAFYARQDTHTPLRAAAWALLANVVLNLALIVPLAHAGLALATGLAAFLNAGLLLRGLIRRGLYTAEPGWPGHLARVAGAVAAMAAAGWWLSPPAAAWNAAAVGTRALWLAGVVAAAAGAYAGAAWLLGVEEARRAPRWLRARLFDARAGGH